MVHPNLLQVRMEFCDGIVVLEDEPAPRFPRTTVSIGATFPIYYDNCME